MELTKDTNISVNRMPKSLVIVTAIFLAARLIDGGVSLINHLQQTSTTTRVSTIAWNEVAEPIQPAKQAAALQQQIVDARALSPASQAEVDKILARGKSAKKAVLYEFYASWSDPCKIMESASLSNAEVSSLIKERFLPVRVTDRAKEDGANSALVTELQKKYRVFAFPTFVIVDEQGKTVATLVGNCNSLTTYRFLTRGMYSLRIQ